jgi:molybdopterin/thiamine biosynthesis adenylyltransferase
MTPVHDRYHRQRLLPGIGDAGQERLAGAHALIVGCGALGCAAADLLARAGVGTLTIVDRDLVEATNLQRQVLFDEGQIGEPKAAAAADRLARVNSAVRTEPVIADFNATNAESIAAAATGRAPDAILDGTDNYETRFLINDLAVKAGVPYLYAGAVGTRGMAASFLPPFGEDGPCLRCLFDGPPPPGSQPTCDTAGVLGPVIATVAGVQAGEAIKVLAGAPGRVRGTMLEFDAWANTRRTIELAPMRDPACACCARRSFEYLGRPAAEPVSICGRDAIQVLPSGAGRVDLAALAERLDAHGSFVATRFLVRGSFASETGESGEPVGLTVFGDGRALIQGVTDSSRARSMYAKYVGA